MPDKITKRLRTAYYAPSKGRHYFSLRAAIRAEATARIKRRYPSQKDSIDEPGFYWKEDVANADKLLRRMCAYIRAWGVA